MSVDAGVLFDIESGEIMNWMEIGGMAGAVLSLWTLVSKIIHLICCIQSLIERLDKMQATLDLHHEALQTTQTLAQDTAQQLRRIQAESSMHEVSDALQLASLPHGI